MGFFDRFTTKQNTTGQSISFEQMQGKTMDAGFSLGSKLSLVGLPLSLRNRSFADIVFNNSDLAALMSQLSINSSEIKEVSKSIEKAMPQENSIEAASKLLEGVNKIKDLLSNSKFPDLMRVFRIGFALGFTMETAAIMSKNNPTEKHLDVFVSLTQKYRDPLPDDIAQSKLPTHIVEQIRRTNIEVNSVSDLNKIITGCKDILKETKSF